MPLAPVPPRSEIVQLYNAGELAGELSQYHEHEGDDDPFIASCIDLHNAGEIDLLAVVGTPEFAAITGGGFFTAQHAYCEAIPKLRVDVTALMKCCSTLVTQAGNDGAAGQPNIAFQNWCAAHPREAEKVVQLAVEGDKEAREFLAFALRSLKDVDAAIRVLDAFDGDRRNSAINALGNIIYPDAASAERAIGALEQFWGELAADPVRSNAVFATFDILRRHPDAPATKRLVQKAVVSAGPNTLHALADAFWMHGQELDQDSLVLILNAVRSVPRENLGTVRTIDHGLHRLLGTLNEGPAIDCLSDLLRDGTLTLKEFNTTAHDLRRPHSPRLFELLVRWLQSGSVPLCRAANDLVGVERDHPFTTSAVIPAMNTPDRVFLARKAIGYLILKPVICCSFLVALIRGADVEAGAEIGKLLFDPLLLNFGGGAKDYLKTIVDTDPAYACVQSALEQDSRFNLGLDSTGEVRELHPSDHRREIIWQRSHDEMVKVRKSAERQSVFFNLVRRSTMLYGHRSLSYVEDPGGEQRAISMDLKSMSVKVEMPRHEVVDPVGLDLMLRIFRVERFK
jgi:hypothetical protein